MTVLSAKQAAALVARVNAANKLTRNLDLRAGFALWESQERLNNEMTFAAPEDDQPPQRVDHGAGCVDINPIIRG